MGEIKPGDVISVMSYDRKELGAGNHYKLRPCKFRVEKVYKHFALCRSLKTGIKECFTWWQLRTYMIEGGKA